MTDALLEAYKVAEEDPDQAYELALQYMRDDPQSAPAHTLCGVIMMRAARYGTALAHFHRATDIRPDKVEVWNNLGSCYQEMRFPALARDAFRRSLEVVDNAQTCAQMAVTYTDENDFAQAWKWIRRAEKHDKASPYLTKVRCYVEIATGDWANGWKHWAKTLGSKFRPHKDYGAPL